MFTTIDSVQKAMEEAKYITERSTATVVYLAAKLGKPILVEGEAGVGKTEIAKVLAQILDTRLIRLQCYEGLDAATALYEWNYPKQLLWMKQAEVCASPRDAIGKEIFSPEFLIRRPLLEAIQADSGKQSFCSSMKLIAPTRSSRRFSWKCSRTFRSRSRKSERSGQKKGRWWF